MTKVFEVQDDGLQSWMELWKLLSCSEVVCLQYDNIQWNENCTLYIVQSQGQTISVHLR